MMRSLPPYLRPSDTVTLIFLGVMSAILLVFSDRVDGWVLPAAQNVLFIGLILLAARSVHRSGSQAHPLLRIARDWYLVPMILYIYTQASSIAFSLHGRDYDDVLIAIDRMLFGGDPTVWVYQFAHPVLTEILQLAYSSYYLFFIALIFDFYRRPDRTAFDTGAMMIVYGFYLSYIGYMLVPAVGPRFTLHDFTLTDSELPGLWLTPALREIINAGGGAPSGVTDPLATVHRDAFPSGHTQLTLTAMYLAFHFRSVHRWWLLVVGSLLIISTIYMRYHYGVDVLAGIFFFLLTIKTATILFPRLSPSQSPL